MAHYVSDPTVRDFQPMNANYGLLPPLERPERQKTRRYEQLADRSLHIIDHIGRELSERTAHPLLGGIVMAGIFGLIHFTKEGKGV